MEQSAFARSDTVQDVLSRLRQDILLYQYQDNQPVRELELASKYSCSRGAVRNALVLLEKEGLMITHSNGTKTVSCLNIQDINNIYDLREFIELTAIRQFFDYGNYDMAAVFENANQLRTIEPKAENVESILELDTQFHGHIAKISKNKAIIQTWNNISNVIRIVFSLNLTLSDEYKHDFLSSFKDAHSSLVSSLLSNKSECLSLFKKHIDDARQISVGVVEKMLEDKGK